MEKKHILSGAHTPFKDINGDVIKVHDYVKDGEGNRYYINTHCQAVPEGSDAPAVELDRLLQGTQLTVMTAEDVLNVKPVDGRRRGSRRRTQANPLEQLEKDAAAATEENKRDLHPVTEEMILSCLPDDILAKELRRRGYTLCAVRPALIEL